jgi:protease IV
MKQVIILLLFLVIVSTSAFCQSQTPSYYQQDEFDLASPGAYKLGLFGYVNPALLSLAEQPDLYFTWSDERGRWNDFNHYGIFTSFLHLGFGYVNTKIDSNSVSDYKISTGFGSDAMSIGFGYSWSSGDVNYFNHSNFFTIGAIYRPLRYVSFGLIGNLSSSNNNEGVLDLAVRPLGDEIITLFADYVFGNGRLPEDLKWSTGAAAEVLPGIRITGRYFSNHTFNIGAALSFGRIGLTSDSRFSKDGKYGYNIYGIRVGSYDRNILQKLQSGKDYVNLNLLGGMKYQRYRLFDNSNTLLNTINNIDAATKDNTVSGIVLNLSGMQINREMIWELREKLEAFKAKGKHVIIYLDRVGIDGYYLASAADRIVMNPQGTITLEGYIWGRQYYANLLDKLGIGFTELRYFKYKSAMETFSRTNMSKADSIQWRAIIDEYYGVTKEGICKSRNISPDEFDRLVNETAMFMPSAALKNKLVDTLARWEDIHEIITGYEKENKRMVSPGSLAEFQLPHDNYWGKIPEIAVIYAIGVCAMDEGIKARSLVKVVESVAADKNVKAVVFRVDSPGGDGMASDIVAEALKKCAEKKPVIVSQGYVAGSGGYWLSMYGDEIYAAPTTITGSIGVIGGWYYNKSLMQDIGVSTDLVQIGKHADLPFGMRVPFIGISLPDRDLNKDELKKAKNMIEESYRDFVGKVAKGRNMTYDAVEKIAQGRVWSGQKGKEINLVDQLGGLDDAINEAVKKAGLSKCKYEISEYPEAPWFNFNSLVPKIFGVDIKNDAVMDHLLFRLKFNGIPLYMLPLENMIYDFPLDSY